jgi:hypothetical protein
MLKQKAGSMRTLPFFMTKEMFIVKMTGIFFNDRIEMNRFEYVNQDYARNEMAIFFVSILSFRPKAIVQLCWGEIHFLSATRKLFKISRRPDTSGLLEMTALLIFLNEENVFA